MSRSKTFKIQLITSLAVMLISGCSGKPAARTDASSDSSTNPLHPNTGRVTTLAGSTTKFRYPWGVAVDQVGNVYVADEDNHTIRKITPAGVVSTLAGSAGNPGYINGTGSAANFSTPVGVAVDQVGNVYVADSDNNTIRKITPAGAVSTLAGGGPDTFGNTDGIGTAARFKAPNGVAVDQAGNVYVADSMNNIIRKITSAGVVSTLAGGGPDNPGYKDGTGTAARFNYPIGVAVDQAGNVYVADTFNNTIRKITPTGVVSTLAGSAGNAGSTDSSDGDPLFYQPNGVAVDQDGNVYVADSTNNIIRRITPEGVVSTLAGGGMNSSGSIDGAGTAARFNYPGGVAVDPAGNVYVADSLNSTIRKITSAGVVSTLAGSARHFGSTDTINNGPFFNTPYGVAVDQVGTLYVADQDNSTISKITSAGVVSTLAGIIGVRGHSDGIGTDASFNRPTGVAVDQAGNVYVADQGNNTIRKITPTGVVSTLAGIAGKAGSTDSSDGDPLFNSPSGLTVDRNGNVYVADTDNSTIRKITPAGAVSTLAGSAGHTGSTDTIDGDPLFSYPYGVAADQEGNVYVADQSNSTIRKITPAGVVSTLAGSAGNAGSTDSSDGDPLFKSPSGLTVDQIGNIYVADTGNHTIRKITPAGVVSTFAGIAGNTGSTDTIDGDPLFKSPSGLTVDQIGNVYVADTGNHTIRKITPAGVVSTFAGIAGNTGSTDTIDGDPLFKSPSGLSVDQVGNVYVADAGNSTIRMITPDGAVSTLAGSAGNIGSTDGTGTDARFWSPNGVAVDQTGKVCVADTGNNMIRKIE